MAGDSGSVCGNARAPAAAPWLPLPGARLECASAGMLAIPQLVAFLGAESVAPLRRQGAPDGVIGWGLKPSAARGQAHARRHGLPFWRLEDGFLRSVALGKAGAPPVSLIVDDLGIYYDARTASRLETQLVTADLSGLLDRARALRQRIVAARLSKYNHLEDRPLHLATSHGRRILLVDQVAGDLSVAGALASADSFWRMAQSARDENPSAQLLVRLHPDVRAGLAPSALHAASRRLGLTLIEQDVSIHALLDEIDEVWTVSSQTGFDALLRGIPVSCFGVPFYAGWGLTRDRASGEAAATALARRGVRRRSVDELVAASLLQYSRYADPIRRVELTAEQAIERLLLWRAHSERNAGTALCSGFSRWKRPIAEAFLGGPRSRVRFRNPLLNSAEPVDRHYVWGCKKAARIPGTVQRVEDGFVRSVGLGSDFRFPFSLCVDSRGMYYDATRPSDLENLLATVDFDPALLRRAQALIEQIVGRGISKYNLPAATRVELPGHRPGQPVVLVPGQVPGDASLRLGCCAVSDNLALLAAVRRERPDAYLVYKEHPELVAGNRPGARSASDYARYANRVATGGTIEQWLAICDEVQVMTSLAGFEALVRGKAVSCWGLPFYAGWGLTSDRVPAPRRQRRRSLQELVAASLILYPRYIDPGTGLPCTLEDVIALLANPRESKLSPGSRSKYNHQRRRLLTYLRAQWQGV